MKRLLLVLVLLPAAMGVVASGQRWRPELLGIGNPPQAPVNADAFFDDTVVHDVSLTINSRDWQSLKDNYLDNTYYPCDLRWNGQVVRNIGIRSRGTGSRSGVKPGLRVDFDRYVTDQTFLGLKSVVLRNQTQDASNLHERLSMLLFRRVGLLAPREAHAKLYVNNQYEGLYSIVESIDKGFLKRNVGEDSGYLYKYDYPGEAQPYFFEDRGSRPEAYVPLPFKPETHESDPRPEFVVDLVQTINNTGDASFRTVMVDYLDLVKVVKHVAVERFVADTDGFLSEYGGMNNFYFYRFDNRKFFTLIAWDKSEAFKGAIDYPILHNINDVPSSRQNKLIRRALSYPELMSAYLDALMQCVNSANEKLADSADQRGWLEREVEREYNQIRDAARSDPQKPFTNEQFEQDVQNVMQFARQRGDAVARQVAAARGS